ncbi:ribonuclease H-like domain-containing protein [Tanacetum coccineum]
MLNLLSFWDMRPITVDTDLEGIDVDETFSLVVKPGTIRTNLSLATSRQWPVDQLDAKNEFLHGDLSKTVYMHQLPRFQDVCTSRLCLFITAVSLWAQAGPLGLGTDTAYLLLYIDDIVLIASFKMFLSPRKYATEILERAHMVNCNPRPTLVDTESKLGDDGDPVCLYVHDPREPHFLTLKRILRYVRGTLDHGLQLFSSSTTSLPMLSWSSDEVKYHGVVNDVVEIWWLRNLLCELHIPLSSATHVYCDNVSAIYLSSNPVQHQHMKYIEIDIRFVRDLVAAG